MPWVMLIRLVSVPPDWMSSTAPAPARVSRSTVTALPSVVVPLAESVTSKYLGAVLVRTVAVVVVGTKLVAPGRPLASVGAGSAACAVASCALR